MDTNHRLIDAFSMMPWAVDEETYLLIQDILYNKEKYIKLAEDRQKAEEQQSQDGNADEPQLLPYVKVHGPVSVMQMHGVMARRMNLMMALSGGVSTQIFGNSLEALIDDPNVKEIFISINSPGGAVDGTPELGDKIFAGRKKKRIVAIADGMAASAAYWVGSQASEFYVTKSGSVGSIGVFREHVNAKKHYEERGFKIEFFRVPEGKAKPNDVEPVDAETRAHVMDLLGTIYNNFVDAVAAGRKKDRQHVLDTFGGGRIVLAEQALEVGMVDGIVDLKTEYKKSKERIEMAEKDETTIQDLQAQIAALEAEKKDLQSEKADLTGKLSTAEADRKQAEQTLAQREDENALERCRVEVKGFKNLDLGENEAQLLHTLDKSNPAQANSLRETFKKNNARMDAHLKPDGGNPPDTGGTVRIPGSKTAAQKLDEKVQELVLEKKFADNPQGWAEAAAYVMQKDPDLAERVGAGANPDLRGDAEEL